MFLELSKPLNILVDEFMIQSESQPKETCSDCSTRKFCKHKSVAYKHPKLKAQWHPFLNIKDLTWAKYCAIIIY